MSYKATNWAWEQALKSGDKFVLVALADMADEKHSCFPSQATLARMVGASERTVRGSVARLTDMGLLSREERRRKDGRKSSDRYFLSVGMDQRQNLPVDDFTGNPRPTSPATHDDFTGRSDRYIEEEPSENHQKEPSDTSGVELFVLEAPQITAGGPTFDEFWAVWPKKVAKPDALRAWVKAVKNVSASLIVEAAILYRDNPSIPERKFIPYAATWLNRAGWDDELPSGGAAPMQRARDVLDLGRQMAAERAAS